MLVRLYRRWQHLLPLWLDRRLGLWVYSPVRHYNVVQDTMSVVRLAWRSRWVSPGRSIPTRRWVGSRIRFLMGAWQRRRALTRALRGARHATRT